MENPIEMDDLGGFTTPIFGGPPIYTNYFRDRHYPPGLQPKKVWSQRVSSPVAKNESAASGENEDLQCTYPRQNVRKIWNHVFLNTSLAGSHPSPHRAGCCSVDSFNCGAFPHKLFMLGFQFAWLVQKNHSLVDSQSEIPMHWVLNYKLLECRFHHHMKISLLRFVLNLLAAPPALHLSHEKNSKINC